MTAPTCRSIYRQGNIPLFHLAVQRALNNYRASRSPRQLLRTSGEKIENLIFGRHIRTAHYFKQRERAGRDKLVRLESLATSRACVGLPAAHKSKNHASAGVAPSNTGASGKEEATSARPDARREREGDDDVTTAR